MICVVTHITCSIPPVAAWFYDGRVVLNFGNSLGIASSVCNIRLTTYCEAGFDACLGSLEILIDSEDWRVIWLFFMGEFAFVPVYSQVDSFRCQNLGLCIGIRP